MSGFGSLPADDREAGIPVERPPDNLADSSNEYLRRIAERYDGPPTNQRFPIQLAAKQSQRIDLQGQRVNSILLTVVTGIVFGYFFDCSAQTGQAALLPDFLFGAGINPGTIQIVIPPRSDYVMTIWEGSGSGTATGVISFQEI